MSGQHHFPQDVLAAKWPTVTMNLAFTKQVFMVTVFLFLPIISLGLPPRKIFQIFPLQVLELVHAIE